MPPNRNPIQDFLEIIHKTPSLWRSIDIRVLAAKVNNQWHNLLTRCYLTHHVPTKVTPLPNLPETEWIGCWQEIWPIKRLPNLIKLIQSGKLNLRSKSIAYLKNQFESDGKAATYGLFSHFFGDISYEHQAAILNWSTNTLLASGDSINRILSELPVEQSRIDEALRVLLKPYDGLSGVIEFGLGYQGRHHSEHASFQLLMPLEACFDVGNCSFGDGKLHFSIIAGSSLVTKACKLGYFAWNQGMKTHSNNVSLPLEEWSEKNGMFAYTGQIPIRNFHHVKMFLQVGDSVAHRVSLVDYASKSQNPRILMYEYVDDELKMLRTYLRSTGDADGSHFEQAVARLLRFAGFEVESFAGNKKFSDAVDTIAYHLSSELILAVECTTGSINSGGKLGKLVLRTREMSEGMKGYQVQGVLATALESNNVSRGEIMQAAEDGLAVLCQEDLFSILEMASNNRPVFEVVSFIRQRIPEKQSSHGGNWYRW